MQSRNELEIEGSLEDESEQLDIPEKNRRVLTKQGDPEIEGLLGKYRRQRLIIQSDFQRQFVWDQKKASRLIESALLDIPIPIIYLSEEEGNKEIVIDGQQRLTSFFSFIEGKFPDGKEFRLNGLKVMKELNAKDFKDLEQEYQERILSYQIRTITFLSNSNNDLKFEVFERLNTGSVPLNHQELRNCIYHGDYIKLLRELSQDNDFRYLLGITGSERRMKDIELVSRFCTFYHFTYLNYKPPMKDFIEKDTRMYRHISEEDKRKLQAAFKNAVSMIRSVFGDHAFKRYFKGNEKNYNGRWISNSINAALYDILMFSFSKRTKSSIIPSSDSIREALMYLMTNDDKFIESIDRSTGNTDAVLLRFRVWEDILEKIVGSSKEQRCFSYKLKEEFYATDPTCAICGQRIRDIDDASLDHIHQFWLGGKTLPENARLAHRYCNWARSKSDNVVFVSQRGKRKIARKITIKEEAHMCEYLWEILYFTAEWLIKNKLLKESDSPIKFPGSKRFVINNEPYHENGHEFFSPKLLTNGLYLEAHAGAENLISNSHKLLRKFQIDENVLKIEVADEENNNTF